MFLKKWIGLPLGRFHLVTLIPAVAKHQGDQNGLLFTFGHFFISSPKFCATFFRSTIYVLNLAKNGLGYILGVFFKNAPGYPDSNSYKAASLTSTSSLQRPLQQDRGIGSV
jgi:hypothetical protein